MSRLTEKFIQKKAIEHLREYYKNKHELEKIYARDEVRTNTNNFNKRADGLLCFNSSKQNLHTVSIEAKSHRTFGSMLTNWNDDKLASHSMIGSIILGLITIIFTHSLAWYWISLITLGAIIVFFFLIFFVVTLLDLSHYQFINVINQVHQYPANEKWIAISKDSLNLTQKIDKPAFFKKTDFDKFLSSCKRQNIGILIVTRRKITIENKPKYQKGNFLDCYCVNGQIRKHLD